MGSKIKDLAESASKKYTELSDKYPEAKLAADLLPGVGAVTSGADAINDAYKGNYRDSALDLLGVIPGAKLIKGTGLTKSFTKFGDKRLEAARNIDRGVDISTYLDKKDKAEKGMKKGGKVKSTASSRGDGCAQRGKTRGTLR
jgi:hypothetical protein